jgi:hypothetical protein
MRTIPAASGRFLPAGLAPLAQAADAFSAACKGRYNRRQLRGGESWTEIFSCPSLSI